MQPMRQSKRPYRQARVRHEKGRVVIPKPLTVLDFFLYRDDP